MLACFDYPKSDGLIRGDKLQDKMQKRQVNAMPARYYVFPFSMNNLFPCQSESVNNFHATQNQYMVYWLLKDAQLTCNRCPFEV